MCETCDSTRHPAQQPAHSPLASPPGSIMPLCAPPPCCPAAERRPSNESITHRLIFGAGTSDATSVPGSRSGTHTPNQAGPHSFTSQAPGPAGQSEGSSRPQGSQATSDGAPTHAAAAEPVPSRAALILPHDAAAAAAAAAAHASKPKLQAGITPTAKRSLPPPKARSAAK